MTCPQGRTERAWGPVSNAKVEWNDGISKCSAKLRCAQRVRLYKYYRYV